MRFNVLSMLWSVSFFRSSSNLVCFFLIPLTPYPLHLFSVGFILYSKTNRRHLMKYLSITIAILSLILSSTQWIYTLYKNRTNFSMSLERFQWYEKPEYDYNQGIFTFMICNLSTAPLTITRMTIKKTSCLITHQWIGDHYYPKFPETDIPTTERQLSPDFPITIAPNGSGLYSIVFHFDLEAKRPGHHIKVTVQTAYKKKIISLYCPTVENNKLYL